MPIIYDEEANGWRLQDPTDAEIDALEEVALDTITRAIAYAAARMTTNVGQGDVYNDEEEDGSSTDENGKHSELDLFDVPEKRSEEKPSEADIIQFPGFNFGFRKPGDKPN